MAYSVVVANNESLKDIVHAIFVIERRDAETRTIEAVRRATPTDLSAYANDEYLPDTVLYVPTLPGTPRRLIGTTQAIQDANAAGIRSHLDLARMDEASFNALVKTATAESSVDPEWTSTVQRWRRQPTMATSQSA